MVELSWYSRIYLFFNTTFLRGVKKRREIGSTGQDFVISSSFFAPHFPFLGHSFWFIACISLFADGLQHAINMLVILIVIVIPPIATAPLSSYLTCLW